MGPLPSLFKPGMLTQLWPTQTINHFRQARGAAGWPLQLSSTGLDSSRALSPDQPLGITLNFTC